MTMEERLNSLTPEVAARVYHRLMMFKGPIGMPFEFLVAQAEAEVNGGVELPAPAAARVEDSTDEEATSLVARAMGEWRKRKGLQDSERR